MVCANSLTMHGTITSIARAYVQQYLLLSHFWVGALLYEVAIVFDSFNSGLYLTDVTFCREGNTSHRTSPLAADKKLINFSKYHKMARIVQGTVAFYSEMRMTESSLSDIQRFQVHYSLKEIPEVQDFLNEAFERSKHHGDLQDLYRRRYGCPILLQGYH